MGEWEGSHGEGSVMPGSGSVKVSLLTLQRSKAA